MILRSSRLLLQIFAALSIGAVLFGLAVVWQLAQGPIRLSFLNGYIEQALNPEGSSAQLTLRETVLAWSSERQSLDVQALGVELRDQDGRPLARIPELSINFSGRALLRGLIAPQGLEIRGPRLRISLGRDEPVVSGLDEPVPAAPGRALSLLTQLLQPPDDSSAAGYLTSVRVVNGQLAVRDQSRNLAWDITDANLDITRDDVGIRADARLTVTAGGVTGRFRARAQRTALRPGLAAQLVFDDLEPKLLARVEPRLNFLERLDMRLAGSLDLRLDETFRLQNLRYDLAAGAGSIDLPEFYPEPLTLARASASGSIEADFRTLRIDAAEIDLGGPVASLRGSVSSNEDTLTIALDAEARDVPVDALDTLWPRDIGRGARNWVTANLEAGMVNRATMALVASAPVDDPLAIQVSELGGVMDASGVTVHYFRPMAPVLDVNGDIRFDASQFVIKVNSGGLRDLVVEEGVIAINLAGPEQVANIDITITGSVSDALTVLDMEPLGYATALGIDPRQMGGEQRTNATFRIPLRRNLSLDDIGVAAAAGITGFSQAQGLFGLPLDNGTLSLEVDTRQLSAWGNISLGQVPVEARWTERFVDDGGFRTRYEVSGIFDQAAIASLGLDLSANLSGAIGVGISYAIFPDSRAIGAADLDLTAADISIPAIGLRKEGGSAAQGALSFTVDAGALTDISRFEITGDELVATGAIRFAAADQGGGLREIGLSRLAYGGNELFGTVVLADDGALDIRLGGQTLDLRQQVRDLADSDGDLDGDDDGAGEPETPPRAGLAVRLAIDPDAPIAEVRLGEVTRLLDVSGRIVHDGTRLRSADLRGGLVEPDDVALIVVDATQRRGFTLAVADGGALLSALDWTDAIRGGRLTIEGEMRDDEAGEPLIGQVLMTDFQMTKAPLLGRLLTLASLRGIGDTLSGDGIAFSRLEIPFVLTETNIELPAIKMRGSELGILAEGRIDRTAATINLRGEIAPAYTLNSLLGKLPVLGDILTGGGDGIFAATYKVEGPLDSPRMTVNPLSILTPGFTRKILGGFGTGTPATAEPATKFPVDPPFDN